MLEKKNLSFKNPCRVSDVFGDFRRKKLKLVDFLRFLFLVILRFILVSKGFGMNRVDVPV